MQEIYSGSRYTEDEHKLVIPDDESQVTLRRGGCVHFGISIEFRIARTERYDDEAVFLTKVRDLIKEYGQELADQEFLDKAIDNEARHVTRDDTGVYYFLPYPDATFEIFLRHDPEHTTIGISFYD